jgi:hypothetical protein
MYRGAQREMFWKSIFFLTFETFLGLIIKLGDSPWTPTAIKKEFMKKVEMSKS